MSGKPAVGPSYEGLQRKKLLALLITCALAIIAALAEAGTGSIEFGLFFQIRSDIRIFFGSPDIVLFRYIQCHFKSESSFGVIQPFHSSRIIRINTPESTMLHPGIARGEKSKRQCGNQHKGRNVFHINRF